MKEKLGRMWEEVDEVYFNVLSSIWMEWMRQNKDLPGTLNGQTNGSLDDWLVGQGEWLVI